MPVLKIASFEIVDVELIRAAAATGRPLIISTGMAVLGEIEDALAAAVDGGAPAVGLMQCTSVYPAPAERINLRAMAHDGAAPSGVPVGLSDHSLGIAMPIAAAALGAAFVEKHFTLDRTMSGPDHPFAVEPDELRAMVAGIRDAQAALGDGRKDGPSPEEREEMYRLGRRSLIATRDLPAGTLLERDMITTKRPGLRDRAQAPRARARPDAEGRRRGRRHPALGDGLDAARARPRSPCPARPRSGSGSTAATGSPRSSASASGHRPGA